MKIADKLAVPAIVIAGGMAYVAEEFNLPYLIPLAMGLFGLFGIILGIESFASGRIEMFNRLHSRREYFSGVSARLFGVMIFLYGVESRFLPSSNGRNLAQQVSIWRAWSSPHAAGGFSSSPSAFSPCCSG